MAGLFLQVAEISVSAAWMIPAVCALNLIPRAASHAPGAVLSGGAGAQSADAAGSVSGIAPAADLSEPELGFVLAHERAHLRRRDHIWKPLGWLLLSVHWFNPLVWLAYALFCRDVEYACDESVVGGLDADGRRAYARALGVDTILTSGQAASCAQGAELLRELVRRADGMEILVGAGVNASVIAQLLPQTGAHAFHMSGKKTLPSGMAYRREGVPMGLPGLSEFEVWRTDTGEIAAARRVLETHFAG